MLSNATTHPKLGGTSREGSSVSLFFFFLGGGEGVIDFTLGILLQSYDCQNGYVGIYCVI